MLFYSVNGYGAKIQSGGNYLDHQDFILFDVFVNNSDTGTYLDREAVKNIAEYFKIPSVPVVAIGTLEDAVDYAKSKPDSFIGTAKSEGIVARPLFDLRERDGKRIIVKIKVRDYE